MPVIMIRRRGRRSRNNRDAIAITIAGYSQDIAHRNAQSDTGKFNANGSANSDSMGGLRSGNQCQGYDNRKEYALHSMPPRESII